MRSIAFVLLASAALVIATRAAADPLSPAQDKDGWVNLMVPDAWKKFDPAWIITTAGEVRLDPEKDTRLKAEKVNDGTVWLNGEKGRLPNLITKEPFGDCEVHVEFMIAKRSNAGVKFHEVYEIQILDSFSNKEIDGTGMGGVYPRADTKKGGYLDRGIAPKVNAAKPAGEWNTLDVIWRSPRLDAKGDKTASAMIVKATLNGQLIHENVEVKTPTGGNWMKKETANGSFMLQSDHGPTAWRNVRIRPTNKPK
jgi:3-keto-disaccharide hydrolase